jgi:nucleotide-binding universal stress UspA family protein
MKTVNKVLIGTDYSETSLKAAVYALDISEIFSAQVTLCHVYPQFPEVPVTEDQQQADQEYALARFYEKIKEAFGSKPSCTVELVARSGNAVKELYSEAERIKADLIVVGTHGAGVLHRIVGSVATGLSNKGRPVLMVPPSKERFPIKRIVYATDYKEGEIPVVQYVSQFASLLPAEVTVLHITDLTFFGGFEKGLFEVYKRELEEKMPGNSFNFQLLDSGNIVAGIQDFVKDYGADLLVLTQDRSFSVTGLLSLSVTRRLSFTSDIPILVIPEYTGPGQSRFWEEQRLNAGVTY